MGNVRKGLLAIVLTIIWCWVIPAAAAAFVPADAGMAVCMLCFYVLNPVMAAFLGGLSATAPRSLWWVPAFFAGSFAPLLWIAMGGIVPDLFAYAAIYLLVGYTFLFIALVFARLTGFGRRFGSL